jgi:hypothetical protein
MLQQLTKCIRELIAAIHSGDTPSIQAHVKHVVILLTAYVSSKLAEKISHDDDLRPIFGSSGDPEQQEMLAAATGLINELGDQPTTFSGPLTDYLLATLIQLLMTKLADTEFVQKQLDALAELLDELLNLGD